MQSHNIGVVPAPTPDEQTGALVAGFLTQAGITQDGAAAIIGRDRSSVSRRLTGRSPFTATEIARLADVLDLEPSDLIAPAVTR